MKAVGTMVIRPRAIVVHQNTTKNAPNFGVIKDAHSGQVLHRGQVGYIRGLAKRKYSVLAAI
jgi:hypothetical protein